MLTTEDNPYDPRTQFELWLDWDHEQGYFTNEYLSRVANVPPDMDDEEADILYDLAIQSILEENLLGIYKIV